MGVRSQTDVLHISQLADGQLEKRRTVVPTRPEGVKAAIVQPQKEECDEVMGGGFNGLKRRAEASRWIPQNPSRSSRGTFSSS